MGVFRTGIRKDSNDPKCCHIGFDATVVKTIFCSELKVNLNSNRRLVCAASLCTPLILCIGQRRRRQPSSCCSPNQATVSMGWRVASAIPKDRQAEIVDVCAS